MQPFRLKLCIEPQDPLDDAEVMVISHQLIDELQHLDLEVAQMPHESPPQGAKAGDLAIIGTMLVSVLPNVLPHLVDFLMAWTQRSAGAIKIKTKKIEAEFPSGISPEKLKKLIAIINEP